MSDSEDNVAEGGAPKYKDLPDNVEALYVNTKNTWQDAENLDATHDYISYMWIPEEMFSVKIMKLRVFPEKFRAYSQATKVTLPTHSHTLKLLTTTSAGGGAHSHSVTGVTSTPADEGIDGYLPTSFDTLWAHTTSDPGSSVKGFYAVQGNYAAAFCRLEHKHSVSGQTAVAVGTHTHTVDFTAKTTDDGGGEHDHEIKYGIYEETPTGITVSAELYDPKDNLLEKWDPLTTYPTPVTLDLTEYFKDLKYGHYYLKLTVSGRMRVRLVYYELGIMFAM